MTADFMATLNESTTATALKETDRKSTSDAVTDRRSRRTTAICVTAIVTLSLVFVAAVTVLVFMNDSFGDRPEPGVDETKALQPSTSSTRQSPTSDIIKKLDMVDDPETVVSTPSGSASTTADEQRTTETGSTTAARRGNNRTRRPHNGIRKSSTTGLARKRQRRPEQPQRPPSAQTTAVPFSRMAFLRLKSKTVDKSRLSAYSPPSSSSLAALPVLAGREVRLVDLNRRKSSRNTDGDKLDYRIK